MRLFVTMTIAALPAVALAHGAGPRGHAHPHGIEIALIAFACGAAVTLVPTAWRAMRARRRK